MALTDRRFEAAVKGLASGALTLQQAKTIAGIVPATQEERRASFNAMSADIYAQRKKARQQQRMFGVVPYEHDDVDEENISQPSAKPEDVYQRRLGNDPNAASL